MTDPFAPKPDLFRHFEKQGVEAVRGALAKGAFQREPSVRAAAKDWIEMKDKQHTAQIEQEMRDLADENNQTLKKANQIAESAKVIAYDAQKTAARAFWAAFVAAGAAVIAAGAAVIALLN